LGAAAMELHWLSLKWAVTAEQPVNGR
jgi:hypothetical protein